jgi:hypothetical protein
MYEESDFRIIAYRNNPAEGDNDAMSLKRLHEFAVDGTNGTFQDRCPGRKRGPRVGIEATTVGAVSDSRVRCLSNSSSDVQMAEDVRKGATASLSRGPSHVSFAPRVRLGNMVDPKYTLGASILKRYLPTQD